MSGFLDDKKSREADERCLYPLKLIRKGRLRRCIAASVQFQLKYVLVLYLNPAENQDT